METSAESVTLFNSGGVHLAESARMGDVKAELIPPTKEEPELLEQVVALLKKFLQHCLCCLTCGCYPGPKDDLLIEVEDAELMEEERVAVHSLLSYFDSAECKRPRVDDERLSALRVLTYSGNPELQKSAALCYAEISDKMRVAVAEAALEPLLALLSSKDVQVQKAASLAISNFAFMGPEVNKTTILNMGGMQKLVQLLESESAEVQCNACGCVTTLASTDQGKLTVISQKGVNPLLKLAESADLRVQRNATGALLNLSHLRPNRSELVQQGALPILVQVLHSTDPVVQYYCAAALSNMAIDEKHRTMMVAVGHYDALRQLISLLSSPTEKVKCQSCLALRNLASDQDNQVLMVHLKCLPHLQTVIRQSTGETLVAALACLRNLSIHRNNEVSIIEGTFLEELRLVLVNNRNWLAQLHAAGTIRNLAAGDHIQRICRSGCVEAVTDIVLDAGSNEVVLVEATAALAILADDENTRLKLVRRNRGCVFSCLLRLATEHSNTEVRYNCAGVIGQLSLADLPDLFLSENLQPLLSFLQSFLSQTEHSFVHIGLWTVVQLLRYPVFVDALREELLLKKILELTQSGHTGAIRELATAVLHSIQHS